MGTLQRTTSDISSFLLHVQDNRTGSSLSALSEVEQGKCECCGMSEEWTVEYMDEMREKYSGKMICGLCAEAVQLEMDKNGGRTREDALEEHMNVCVKFNSIGKTYPHLYQADAVKKLFKKTCAAYSRPNSTKKLIKGGGLARTSSCMPSVAQDFNKLRL